MNELLADRSISITTFREGDKADTGYRDAYLNLGFAEAELLTEFGYPTQRLILAKEAGAIPMTRPRTPGNPLAQDFTLIPLLRFAFPTIATMLFMGLYTMTDTIFISRLVNTMRSQPSTSSALSLISW